MEMQEQLAKRLGAHRIKAIQNPLHPEQSLLLLFLELHVPVTICMTNGLSNYTMPVSEKWKGREHNELFFCLPAYWDLDDLENRAFSWVYDWIFRLENFVRSKNTWFGPGHTIPCGNPPAAISPTMKQEYFIFLEPLLLNEAMAAVKLGEKTVRFLAIVPIFGDELDFKMGKGTTKFVAKLTNRGFDERLDDYRPSALRSRLLFF